MKQCCNFPLQPEEGGTFVPPSFYYVLVLQRLREVRAGEV
jgi:hypothetical protein